eukprot:8133616-Pyramimonas_sp.AAC.1
MRLSRCSKRCSPLSYRTASNSCAWLRNEGPRHGYRAARHCRCGALVPVQSYFVTVLSVQSESVNRNRKHSFQRSKGEGSCEGSSRKNFALCTYTRSVVCRQNTSVVHFIAAHVHHSVHQGPRRNYEY